MRSPEQHARLHHAINYSSSPERNSTPIGALFLLMTPPLSRNELDHPLYVIGSGSKIFQSLDWGFSYGSVSGRTADLGQMPSFASGSTIVIFADPPTIDDALAMMTSIIGSSSDDADVHIVFISSISALFGQSDLFPGSGTYSRKKEALENFLTSSKPADRVSIIRFGNVFECSGWRDIATSCRLALLPRGFDRCAASDIAPIRSRLIDIVSERRPGIFNLWEDRAVAGFFAATRHVPGLLPLYRHRLGRIGIKVAAKLLRRAGIYLPSPDDIDSFNTRFLERLAA